MIHFNPTGALNMMKFAKTLIFSSIMICCSSLISAQPNTNVEHYNSKIDLSIQPAVIGLWKLVESPKHCTEYYNFTTQNSKLVVNSGKEWVVGQYAYQFPEFHENKQPMLMWEIKYDNNEMDCHGQQIDQSGNLSLFSVKWHNPHKFELCDALSKQCIITLERVLP